MTLKKRYPNDSDIPEAVRSFYTERDGNWVLDIENEDDVAGKRKLAEFRDQNLELKAKLASFDGIDPDTVKRAMSSLSHQEDENISGMLKRGEFDKVLDMEKGRLAKSHQAQLEALQSERDVFEGKVKTLGGRFGDILLAQKIDATLAAKKMRIHPSAKDDLIARARGVFKANEDVSDIAPIDGVYDGQGKPYSSASWLDDQVAKAPHLFEGGGGGGARSGGGGGSKALYNRDEYRNDPEGFARVSTEINEGKASWQES
tara:strand:- start:201 stop:977 length:777 start_codon:yes stop_codon:yes gene_type:complete